MMPKTKLGRWAGALAALFVALLIVVLNQRNLLGWKIGDPRLILLGISMMVSGMAAFVTGIISIFKLKDRSLIVLLAVIFGFIAVLMVIMEVLEGITERAAH